MKKIYSVTLILKSLKEYKVVYTDHSTETFETETAPKEITNFIINNLESASENTICYSFAEPQVRTIKYSK